jgi:hypothetical protein
VPVLPGLSVVVNVYLMMMLSVETWIRFGVWMAVGKPVLYKYKVLQHTIADSVVPAILLETLGLHLMFFIISLLYSLKYNCLSQWKDLQNKGNI